MKKLVIAYIQVELEIDVKDFDSKNHEELMKNIIDNTLLDENNRKNFDRIEIVDIKSAKDSA